MNTCAPLVITPENVDEYEPGTFHADASDLGLAVGEVPPVLETTLGNTKNFMLIKHTASAFYYSQVCGGITLTIYND